MRKILWLVCTMFLINCTAYKYSSTLKDLQIIELAIIEPSVKINSANSPVTMVHNSKCVEDIQDNIIMYLKKYFQDVSIISVKQQISNKNSKNIEKNKINNMKNYESDVDLKKLSTTLNIRKKENISKINVDSDISNLALDMSSGYISPSIRANLFLLREANDIGKIEINHNIQNAVRSTKARFIAIVSSTGFSRWVGGGRSNMEFAIYDTKKSIFIFYDYNSVTRSPLAASTIKSNIRKIYNNFRIVKSGR